MRLFLFKYPYDEYLVIWEIVLSLHVWDELLLRVIAGDRDGDHDEQEDDHREHDHQGEDEEEDDAGGVRAVLTT